MNKNTHKQNLIDLYLKSFDDNVTYVNYFFDNYYSEKNCVSIYKKGRCISALHLVDKELSFLGKSIKCPYIFAASTMAEFQKQGNFRAVLNAAFKRLYKRGDSVCALYPFEHSFYQKFGFATVCYVQNIKLVFSEAAEKKSDTKTDCLTGIYNEYFKNFDIYVKRQNADMQKKVDECMISGGKLIVFDNSYILYDNNDSEVVLNNSDLKALNGFFELNNFTVQTYSEKFDVSYTMVRIINVKKLIRAIPYSCEDNNIRLKITDDFFKKNNVTIEINIKNNRAMVKDCKDFDEQISVSDLCLLIFGTYKSGAFSKMLTGIFPKRRTYLIDQI
ncbi:MAG: GNAT family N-acetyltransferase [Firmicutes bacterium]|nr:GNAT family N-acetyltransferase [Bacillota bacterium]